jgi:N-acetylglucosamine-6-phosphate deacetylase
VAFSAAPFDPVARACSRLTSTAAGSGCLGVLLEGTFVNPEASGGQRAEAMVSPDSPDALGWLDLPGVRGVVVAPELPGGIELIGEAARRGLIPSVGHTLASGDVLRRAQASGARMITHFFNNGGAPSWGGREPGLLGAGLLDPNWWLEVIADGLHVHPVNLALLRRSRGTSRVCMVSDARSAAGLADGEHLLGDGVPVTKSGPRLVTATGTLAGGGISLGGAVAAALAGGAPPAPLFAMASANPARLLGLYPGRGAVAVGSSADLTAWSVDGGLHLALSEGRIFEA